MSPLASGVNTLNEVNAKRMKLEAKDKKDNQLHLLMLFHPFPTDVVTVRPHFVTMNSDSEQTLYVYSRFIEYDLKKHGQLG